MQNNYQIGNFFTFKRVCISGRCAPLFDSCNFFCEIFSCSAQLRAQFVYITGISPTSGKVAGFGTGLFY
jgi:hypothetical protein